MPAVDLYIAYITDQAVGKYNLLPVWLVDALRAQKAFPTLDLGKVRYAEGIETMQGDRPITLEYNIFFPDTLNIADQNADRADVLAVLHELEHVAQTKRHDGVRPYCNKFIIQSAGAVSQSLQRRSWRAFVKNLHEYDGIEKDAVDKAKRLIDVVMEAAIRPPPES
ncbi:hypothetical protein BDY21DRAFT_371043 [Lineolata rhizophorae]|uniref:Phage metallopeptidase domain-containing protein n=1 Tax=Lineolata rhizophorae TaxID=578093 RepID=A0A6A6P2P4_9PEZI|nr:hypothetical protein BDY21DRAFT_371043 [Lineolata rhizophorae]